MIEIRRIKTSDKDYIYIEELLIKAFPQEERRDEINQRHYTDNNPQFYCNSISVNNIFIGLLNYWNFTDYIYIEHFAIVESHRKNGYGAKSLQKLKETVKIPIVLEAEEPTDLISKRRIEFYRRQGFILEDYPYMQPPYRKNDEWLPMKLLTFGLKSTENKLNTIKCRIYKDVYEL